MFVFEESSPKEVVLFTLMKREKTEVSPVNELYKITEIVQATMLQNKRMTIGKIRNKRIHERHWK